MELATYETITEILPIEGADRIELARVQGWQSVIKKGEYKVGDQVIFVPIDTVLTPRPWNEFLWDKNDPTKPIRVKTVKLRGTVSQGLIFPTSLISAQEVWDHRDDPDEDTSIAGMLGITKYEKPVPAQLAGQARGNFPTHWVSKTDEDNLKSNIRVLDELREAHFVDASLKLDGTSATYIKELDGTFRVCSRNLELKDTPESVYWQMARKYNIAETLPEGFCIQGEIVGPGIQGNNIGLSEVKLFVFNVSNIQTREYLTGFQPDGKFASICPALASVPSVRNWSKDSFSDLTVDELQEYANTLKYASNKPAEGIVLRGYDKDGNLLKSKRLQKMLSVKIINQNFKD